jgi:integrase
VTAVAIASKSRYSPTREYIRRDRDESVPQAERHPAQPSSPSGHVPSSQRDRQAVGDPRPSGEGSDIDWRGATVTVDEAVIPSNGGAVIKSPKTRTSIRTVAIDKTTLAQLRTLHKEQERLATNGGVALPGEAFAFSAEPGGLVPPYPDTISRAFAKARKAAKLPDDLRLHSLRHFQATSLDTVIPERQKQARLGWSTVHMARHYTDAISNEDQKAAEHIGTLLDS